MAVDPARDCPPCPACGCNLGTPTGDDAMVFRWDGPPDATLFCPACGTGWIGSHEHVAQAWASWRAYEREMRNEASCPKCCACPHSADTHGYAGCSGLIGERMCACLWDGHYHPKAPADRATERKP